MHNDLNSCILKKVREGPSYICSACNRLLYRKTVTELKKGKYIIQHIFTGKESRDNKEYICNKCSSRDRSCVKLSITDYSLMKFPQNLNVQKNLRKFSQLSSFSFKKQLSCPKVKYERLNWLFAMCLQIVIKHAMFAKTI